MHFLTSFARLRAFQLSIFPFSTPIRRSNSRKSQTSNSDYCMNLVKNSDYEKYLTLLLLPSSTAKTSAFAIAAFNVQIAQVFDVTTDRKISQMRLQFWRDTLDLVYECRPPEQPVALELCRAVQRHKLNKHWLKRLIDGRNRYLDNRAFNTVEDIETYSENTASSFYYSLLEIIGIKNISADHAASHIGKAMGLVTVLRAVPYYGNKGQVNLPLYTLLEHQVSEEEIIRGSRERKVKDVFYDLASSAHSHLQKAKSLAKEVPKQAHVAFLCTVNLDKYLDALQKADFDAFDAKLLQRNNLLPLYLLIRKWKGGF